MRKKKKFSKISQWWFMFKINIMIKRMDIDHGIHRFFYCRKGFHLIRPDSVEVRSSKFNRRKKKWIERVTFRLRWLRCPYCNYLFFSSEKDKLKYERHKEREMRMFKRAFKFDKNKLDKNAGKKDKGTVSKDVRKS